MNENIDIMQPIRRNPAGAVRNQRTNRLSTFVPILAVMTAFIAAGSGARERLHPGRWVELPTIGLKIRPFENFVNSPIPSPVSQTIQNPFTDEFAELYHCRDLWLRDQEPIVFRGAVGSIIVAELRYPAIDPDRCVSDQLVTTADYERIRETLTTKWDNSSIRQWVESASGLKISASRTRIDGLHVSYPYVQFLFENENPIYHQAFVIRLGGGKNRRFVMVGFRLHERAGIRNPEKAISLCLNSVRAIEKQSVSKNVSVKLQHRYAASPAAMENSARSNARERVIASIRNLSGWWFVETPHYIITSNLPSDQRRLVILIQKNIETIRGAYEVLFPPVRSLDEVSVIRVFDTRRGYVDYVGPALQWTGGIWHPGRKELVISPDYFHGKQLDDDAILRTIYHEGFHQYIHYAYYGVALPIWYNEGHAAFFESCTITQGTNWMRVIDNPDYLRVIEPFVDGKKSIDFVSLFGMSRESFYRGDPTSNTNHVMSRSENYALSWALVYFLRKAAYLYPDRPYDQVCPGINNVLLTNGNNPSLIVNAVEGLVDMRRLTSDFLKFWNSSSRQLRARQNDLFRQ